MAGINLMYKSISKESLYYLMELSKLPNLIQESIIQSIIKFQTSELIMIFWILKKIYSILKSIWAIIWILKKVEAWILEQMILITTQWITKFQTLELIKIFSTLKDIWKRLLKKLVKQAGTDMDGTNSTFNSIENPYFHMEKFKQLLPRKELIIQLIIQFQALVLIVILLTLKVT